MQKDMSYFMLATFADAFRNTRSARRAGAPRAWSDAHADYQGADLGTLEPEEMEAVLADTVLKEFKTRLGRIGIEYQTPGPPELSGRAMGTGQPVDIHDLDPEQFLDEVHSFEFWFQAVEGYLSGTTYGHEPDTAAPPLAAERSRAADHRALQLLRRRDGRARGRERADRHRAQPPGQGLPLHAGRRRGTSPGGLPAPPARARASPIRRRRSSGAEPAACSSSAAACSSWWRARTGRPPSSRRTSSSSRSSSRSSRRTPGTPTRSPPRCSAASSRTSAVTSASARTSWGGASPPRRTSARGSGEPRRSSTTSCSTPSRRPRATSACLDAERERLGRAYLESVERLGFAP